jgi:integrase
MSIFKRKRSPYWQYDFAINGHRFRGSTSTEVKSEAKAFVKKLRSEKFLSNLEGAKDGLRLTIAKAFEKYMAEHGDHLTSGESIRSILAQVQRKLGGTTQLCDITNGMVATMVAELRRDVSPATVNRHLQFLQAVINRASDAWDAKIPAIKWRVHMLKEPPARDRWLTAGEINQLVMEADDYLKGPLVFTLLTGVRQRNCLDLNWREVDLEAGVINMIVKGNRRQLIHISPSLHNLLVKLEPRSEGLVFTKNGNPITSVRSNFMSACSRAGITDFRWHDLRHTFATWLMRSGANLSVVRDALGHAEIKTTMRYAHHSRQELSQAMNRMNENLLTHQGEVNEESAVRTTGN